MEARDDGQHDGSVTLLLRASASPGSATKLAHKLSLPSPFRFPFGFRLGSKRPPPASRSHSRPRRRKTPSIRLGGGSSSSVPSGRTRSRFRFFLSGHIHRLRLRWLAAYYSRVLLARLRSLCDAAARGLAEAAWGLQEVTAGPTGVAQSYSAAVPVVSLPFQPSYVLR